MRKLISKLTDLEISLTGFFVISLVFLLGVSLLTLSGCGGGDSSDKSLPSPFGSESPVISTGSENYDPLSGTPITSPSELCTSTETVSIDTSPINFELGELANSDNDIECHTIAVNRCVSYSAEITADDNASLKQFYLSRDDGSEIKGRLSDFQGPVKVCYRRSELGKHSAYLNLVSSGATPFATVIGVSGSTVAPFFNLSSPANGQLIWEKDGVSSFDGKQFSISARGSLSREVLGILSEQSIEIASAGKKEIVNLSGDGSFSSTIILPLSPAVVYPVTFTVKTTEGKFKKVVNLIRYTLPDATLEIRDGKDGSRVTSFVENEDKAKRKGKVTDSATLNLGLIVGNLDVSSPTSTKALTASLILKRTGKEDLAFDFSKLSADNPDGNVAWLPAATVTSKNFSFNAEERKKIDDSQAVVPGRCGTGFDKPYQSFCVPFPKTALLAKGANTIVATVCNDYTRSFSTLYPDGCIHTQTTILVDNSIPKIELISPLENRIYSAADTSTDSVLLKGYLYNFIPTSKSVVKVNGQDVEQINNEVKIWVNSAAIEGQEIVLPPDSLKILDLVDDDLLTANRGNIKKASFSINLSSSFKNKLTLFTNLIHIRVKNSNGHVATQTVSFQRGEYKESAISPSGNVKNISSSQLGKLVNTNIQQTPVMLALTEEALRDGDMKEVIKQLLNKNLNFGNLAMGGGLRKDKDGNVKPIGTGTAAPVTDFQKLIRMLHGSAPEQVRAILDYQARHGSNDYFDADVGTDMCGAPITTAVISPDMYKYVIRNETPSNFGNRRYGLREWPRAICNKSGAPDIANPDCNTTEQGNWDIDIDLKNKGFVDLKLILDGKVDSNGRKLPAFWGHFNAYNLTDEGTTGRYTGLGNLMGPLANLPVLKLLKDKGVADPVIPLLMNVGRLEINLKDALRVYKAQLDTNGKFQMCNVPGSNFQAPCECAGVSCSNVMWIYRDKITTDNIAFEPYLGCKEYFQSKWPNANLPWGCNAGGTTLPFLIDTNSDQGYLLWRTAGDQGRNDSLLYLVRSVFKNTFKNILSCVNNYTTAPDPILINTMINPVATPYPSWFPEDEKKSSLTMAVGTDDKGTQIGLVDDVKDPMFTISPNVKDADLSIQNGGIKAKLPLSIGASNVESVPTTQDEKNKNLRRLGYIFRSANPNLDLSFPELPANKLNDVFASVSIGIEELAQSATHILWQKGPLAVLDLIDKKWRKDLGLTSDWKVGIDNVILGKLDICGSVDVLQATLPPGILFTNVSNLFANPDASHWEIMLDKNSPPTVAILPVQSVYPNVPVSDQSKLIQIGLTNVQVAIQDQVRNAEGKYSREHKQLFTIRLDLMVRLIVKYNQDKRLLEAYVLPLNKTPIYLSVVDRGGSYNDEAVIKELRDTVLNQLWAKFGKDAFSESSSTTSLSPSIAIKLSESLASLDNINDDDHKITDFKKFEAWDATTGGSAFGNFIGAASVGNCDNTTPPKYVGDTDSTDTTDDAPANTDEDDEDDLNVAHCKEIHKDDPIQKALCGLGVEDVVLPDKSPKIVLDSDNGYIHLSTSLIFQVYDWINNDGD